MKRSISKKSKSRRTLVVCLVAGLLVALGSLGLYSWRNHADTTQPSVDASTAPTTTAAPATQVSSQEPNPTADVPGGSTGSGATSQVALAVPSGNFVSNHSPSLSGSDGRNQEQSVCTTTVGASCEITFSKQGVVKSLGQRKVEGAKEGQSGTASWETWTPASLGLSVGEWQITAIARLEGQTKTTVDTLKLMVQP